MITKNYKGSFMNELYKALKDNPDMSLGDILFSFLRPQFLDNHYFYASDKEIYDAIERFNRIEKDLEDSPMDEQGFSFWVEQVTIIK